MIQEQKEHLLKDLCERLHYGVKVHAKYTDLEETIEVDGIVKMIDDDGVVGIEVICDTSSAWTYVQIDNIKPYLFPMSSMNEEQYDEYTDMGYSVTERWWSMANYHQIDWFNKNHFDYRGLIQMGLALDATNFNIY